MPGALLWPGQVLTAVGRLQHAGRRPSILYVVVGGAQ